MTNRQQPAPRPYFVLHQNQLIADSSVLS